ncbi:MAG: 50S ribosome-binding GTPase [Bacteroidaceae bacterium]|nr:50S ribosome-binding GTPase [Bacteroidaceae bacterium]
MLNNKQTTIDKIEEALLKANIPGVDKKEAEAAFNRLRNNRLNVLITGATGCGKSSTINALFDMEVAEVGVGVDPETMDIEKYELQNMTIWDSPGLGDGKETDRRHAENIISKLLELDKDGNPLIDLVLVILDGSSRDLGTSYELINKVIIPNLGENKEGRILVAINQADMAMKGRNWDYENNRPNAQLVAFLEEKVESVRRRIFEGTGVHVDPIYYAAGYKEEGGAQERPYNLSKLLYYMVQATPEEKRILFVDNQNKNEQMWQDDDRLENYRRKTVEKIRDSVAGAIAGAKIGAKLGSMFGPVGSVIGGVIGGAIGLLGGLFG